MMKGIPAERLRGIMAFFSTSLGVRYTYCHFGGAYDKEKPKRRALLSMVHDTLNKYYNGNGPIGCYGCHHGQTEPEPERGK
jgi:hypothetical protein